MVTCDTDEHAFFKCDTPLMYRNTHLHTLNSESMRIIIVIQVIYKFKYSK